MDTNESPKLSSFIDSITRDIASLAKGHVDLAKAELQESAKGVAMSSVFIITAIAFANLGIILLFIAAAYGLTAAGISPWLAFLIVSAILLLLSALAVFLGIRKMRKATSPTKARDSLKTTAQAVTQLMESIDFT